VEASVRSSNPVLTRLTPETMSGRAPQGRNLDSPVYYTPSAVTPAVTERMTHDDVVVRTVGLLAVLGITGAIAWTLVPAESTRGVVFLSAIAALVVGLVVSFSRTVRPWLIISYAVLEGVAVGLISKVYAFFFDGIITQAVIGTFGVFAIMAVLYRTKLLRATPRFTKGVVGAMGGILVLATVNYLLRWFGVDMGLRGSANGTVAWYAYAFSIVCIVVAALTFILDFDLVDRAVAAGADKKMAWYCSFGIVLGLVWLYLEILRLLSYLQGRN
jgi:uncharacterized YccA/Bax inhibitor family protein